MSPLAASESLKRPFRDALSIMPPVVSGFFFFWHMAGYKKRGQMASTAETPGCRGKKFDLTLFTNTKKI
jgi:hypothetical protein